MMIDNGRKRYRLARLKLSHVLSINPNLCLFVLYFMYVTIGYENDILVILSDVSALNFNL